MRPANMRPPAIRRQSYKAPHMMIVRLVTTLSLVSVFPIGSLSASVTPLKILFHDFFLPESKMRVVSYLWEIGTLMITIPADADTMSGEDTFWEPTAIKSSCPDLKIPATVQHMLERTGRHVTSMLAEVLIQDRVGIARNLVSMDSKVVPEGFKFCTVRGLTHFSSWELEEVEEVSTTFQIPPGWHVRVAVSNSFEPRQVIVLFDHQRLISSEEVREASFQMDSPDSGSLVYGRSYRFTSLPDTPIMMESRTDVTSEEEAHAEDSPEETFCMDMGMPMVMFLRGFRSSLYSNETLPCISYYVRSWVLDEEGKFKGAMVYSFLLGLLTQGLTVLRVLVSLNVKRRDLKKYLRVAIYICQVFMGYILMLIAMTYSVELLLSIVVGVAFGYFLFHKGQPQSKHSSGLREPLLTGLREPLLTGNGRRLHNT